MATERLALADSLPRGVTRGTAARREAERISTRSEALDRLLGGGFPRGRLSEVCGRASSGRTSLLHGVLAAATARGEVAALVDAADRFDPRGAAAAGVALSRILWVRLDDAAAALRSSEQLLGARGFGLVVLDLADGVPARLAMRAESVWPRLAHRAAVSRAALVVVTRERTAGGAAEVCLELRDPCPLWPRHRLGVGLFDGFQSRAVVVRLRGRPTGDSVRLRLAGLPL